MLVISVQGHKDSGKTRLVVMFIEAFRRLGLRVASAKHVHRAGFSIDVRGKDSWRHAEAGARPVVIVSEGEVAVIWRGRKVESVEDVKGLVGGVDVLVLEGFRELLSDAKDVVRVALIKRSEELKEFQGADVVATFKDVGEEGVYKLPEQFSNLLGRIMGAVGAR